mmetsp:Transcript_4630/g.14771  ORF Transcript_4630/g.14771 Transcript_4630/m.14771 type:complete len:324 (-) Transcript_4630:598-1569(-)
MSATGAENTTKNMRKLTRPWTLFRKRASARFRVRPGDQPLGVNGVGGFSTSFCWIVSCSVESDADLERRCIVAFRASSCCVTEESSRWTDKTSLTTSARSMSFVSWSLVASSVAARAAASTYSPVTSLTASDAASTSVDFVRPPTDCLNASITPAYASTGIRSVTDTRWSWRLPLSSSQPMPSSRRSAYPPAASTRLVAASATADTSANVRSRMEPVRTSIRATVDGSNAGAWASWSTSPPMVPILTMFRPPPLRIEAISPRAAYGAGAGGGPPRLARIMDTLGPASSSFIAASSAISAIMAIGGAAAASSKPPLSGRSRAPR